MLRTLCIALAALGLTAGAAHALTAVQALAIAKGDNDARIAALDAAAASRDPRLPAFVQALLADEVKIAGDAVYIVQNGKATDAASGAAASLPEAAEDASNNNRLRSRLEATLASLQLLSPEPPGRSAPLREPAKAAPA